MSFLHKLRENALAVVPILALVLLLHWSIAPMSGAMLNAFLSASLLLVLGLTLFLQGTEIGVLPMGELIGSNLSNKQRFPMLLFYGAAIGFSVTLAEPDLQVLAKQLASINPELGESRLIATVAAGAGFFVILGLLRIVLGLSLKKLLTFSYLLIFLLAAFSSPYFVPMAFDSGGVTTGPMTVPFIMALGVGVATVRRAKGGAGSAPDSFGLVSFMSVGPIVAVLSLGLIYDQDLAGVVLPPAQQFSANNMREVLRSFTQHLPDTMREIALALSPLIALFCLFQVFYLKLPLKQLLRIAVGLVYTYVGLVIFLLGVGTGFSPVGSALGTAVGASTYPWLAIPIGLLLGFSIVFAEPAVWVLAREVEEVSAGQIRRSTLLGTLAAAVAAAVALSFLRVLLGFSLWYYLVPGYGLALLMMRLTPRPFTGIAFDSGGVASGVMASTFLLPFSLGICASLNGNVLSDAFGMVAMIALAPLLAIQALGIFFKRKADLLDRAESQWMALADEVLEEDEEEEATMEVAEDAGQS